MYLCINTALRPHHLALIDPSANRTLMQILASGQESETILSHIDSLFKKASCEAKDLHGIFAITGPGSFTSLRVGLSIANAFAHALKIPILGFRTDEWAAFRTDDMGYFYLQSMNPEEVYVIGKGINEGVFDKPILKLQHLIFTLDYECFWLGELSELHQQELPPHFKPIEELRSTEEAWLAICKHPANIKNRLHPYALLEPYYAKEPTITQSKK